MAQREELLVDTFLRVTDTLVTDFDPHELLQTLAERCLQLLDVETAGVMLADRSGRLGTVASSSREMEELEALEIHASEGPSYEAYREGEELICHDLAGTQQRWPSFMEHAAKMDLTAAYGFPLRVRERTIGAFNLYQSGPARPLDAGDLRVARGLAQAATIGLVQDRLLQDAELRADQLEHALSSRIVIEQAKGVLAESLGLDPVSAFERLRSYARGNNLKLRDVASEVVEGGLRDV